MAFVFSAILAVAAVCIQSSIADPINAYTAAAASEAAVNPYNSPWLPSSSYYTPALLDLPPFYMACDCDLSHLLDPRIICELEAISIKFGTRMCNLEQWATIIQDQMPNLDYENTIDIIYQTAAAVRREQIRRGLIYAPDYASYCLDYSSTLGSGVHPAVLSKRDPLYTAADAAAAQNAALNNLSLSPLYYNLQYMLEHFMPEISPQLRMDIQNAVYRNSPFDYFGNAYRLSERLTSNVRAMVGDMIDVTPGSPNDPVHTLVY